MAKDDAKVFDVAKPGDSKPETGSKPMVVGHKFMKDPSVSEASDEKSSKTEQPIAQTSKRIISPISENDSDEAEPKGEDTTELKNDFEASSTKEVDSENTEVKDTTEQPQQPEKETEVKEAEPEVDNTISKKETSDADEAVSNEENLQKIVADKTYFVDIKEASYSSARSFIITFLVVGLIAVVAIAILIDLEILDLGINLPFDYL